MTRDRLFLPGLAVLCFVFCALAVFAAESGNDEESGDSRAAVFARIAEGTAGLRTVSSDFTQGKHVSMLKDPLVSRGRFAYEGPDRLYWEVTEPSPSGFVVIGGKARRWKGDRRRAETFDLDREPMAKAIVEQIFAWTRADFPWLTKRYGIITAEDTPRLVRLVPLLPQEKKYVTHINLTFSADWSYVNSVEIHEKGGDFTRITFSRTVLNEPLKKDLFAR
jgi:hypothetical protein